jgi:hypothetical protein
VGLPKNQWVVGYKRTFKKNEGISRIEGSRYQLRLMAKSCTQVEGIYYNKIFSSVVKHRCIKVIMAIVNQYNLELKQMNVKIAFSHDYLVKEIYMEQLDGFVEDNSKMCLLKKSLYGLNQIPRQ